MPESKLDAELIAELDSMTRMAVFQMPVNMHYGSIIQQAARRLTALSQGVPECFKQLLREVTDDPQAVACVDLRIIYDCETTLASYAAKEGNDG